MSLAPTVISRKVNHMNWFGLIVAGLQVCAAIESAYSKDWQRMLIYIGFAVGSAAVAWK
jgi:hypothetical protein